MTMAKNINTLKILWTQLANIPVNDQDCIEEQFTVTNQVFPKGTSKIDIWQWFDENCPNNLHDDLMFPKQNH